MKKLLIACMMSMGALTMAAQDARSVLTFSVPEIVGTEEALTANVEYVEIDPGTQELESFQWEIRNIAEDGALEADPIYSQVFEGSPAGEFRFPESATTLLEREHAYQLTLVAFDFNGDIVWSFPKAFLYSNYVLTGPTEICCGDPITVKGSWNGDLVFTLGMTHQWTVYACDAAGNITSPNPYYNSGIQQGYPFGDYSFPPAGILCDQYYKVNVTFNPSNDPYTSRPVTRSIIVHVTSFQLTTNTNYCAGQYIYAAGKFCQGPNSPPVMNRQWKLFQSNAAGAILSGNIIPLIPLGGIPNGTNEVIIGTNTLAAGYYVLQLEFLSSSNAFLGSASKLIVVNPSPQAAISASASCGVLGANATPTGAGYTYTWSAFNGNTPYSPLNAYLSSMSAGPGAVNKAKVVVTNQYGCSSTAIATVSNPMPNMTGNFGLTFTSTASNEYYVTVNRSGSYSLSGVYDVFSVMDVTNGNLSWKPCWTATAAWSSNIRFSGYDGGSFMGAPMSPNTCPGVWYPNGRFYKDKNYYIEHYLTYNGCTFIVSKTFNWSQGVVSCSGCRTVNTEGETEVTFEPTTFDVFPNPTNGAFTVLMTEEADNAQAELVNVLGERVDAFTFSGNMYNYSPSQTLAPGIYMLRLTNNGTQFTKRIIIQ